MRKSLFTLLITLLGTISHCAEKVYTDKQGVIRWTENRKEVALFGANYCLPSACDFRAADYVGGDRKQMIVEDLEHFKRMNWEDYVSAFGETIRIRIVREICWRMNICICWTI